MDLSSGEKVTFIFIVFMFVIVILGFSGFVLLLVGWGKKFLVEDKMVLKINSLIKIEFTYHHK